MHCGDRLPAAARFCPQCGADPGRAAPVALPPAGPGPSWQSPQDEPAQPRPDGSGPSWLPPGPDGLREGDDGPAAAPAEFRVAGVFRAGWRRYRSGWGGHVLNALRFFLPGATLSLLARLAGQEVLAWVLSVVGLVVGALVFHTYHVHEAAVARGGGPAGAGDRRFLARVLEMRPHVGAMARLLAAYGVWVGVLVGLAVAVLRTTFPADLLLLLVYLAFLVATYVALPRIVTIVPVLVVENLALWPAARRSSRLSRGHSWRLVGLSLAWAALLMLAVLLAWLLALALQVPEPWLEYFRDMLAEAFVGPYFILMLTETYFQLRERGPATADAGLAAPAPAAGPAV
jgi:hypothetical protein